MFDILKKYNFWDGQKIPCGFFRNSYFDQIRSMTGNKLVKVILGQRRSGKSFLLRMIMQHLIDSGVSANNILYINKEFDELNEISDNISLLKAVNEYIEKMKPMGKIYLFLDEVQEIDSWEKAVNSFAQNYVTEFEVFITGSNAHMLSGELATYLSGRYITINVYPFSFEEFCDSKNISKDKTSFMEYMKTGGIPEIIFLNNYDNQLNYMKVLRDSIILRDVITRYNVRDAYLLDRIYAFTADSIGSFTSVNSLANYMKSNGYSGNIETVGSYLGYLENAFLIHKSVRFDIKGKKMFSREKKYYLNDVGFRSFFSSSFDSAIGKYLENIIFISLLRNGYSVYTGTINGSEIDFIAEKNGEKQYIQVTYLLSSDEIINREFGNLEMINDNYPKTVVSLDEMSFGNRNGIRHMTAWEFEKELRK